MKVEPKYLFIFFVVIAWGFIYAYIQENNPKSEDEVTKTTVGSINDAVKLTVEGNLNVYYFDVGQADSILLENNGKYMLIDAGNNADGEPLVEYFNDLGIESFEYVIATHAHEDHIGGMDDVINNFEVKNFYMPDVVTTSKTFENLLDALESRSVAFQTPEIGSLFVFGGCKFEVLHVGTESDDLNDTSIIVRGLYGNNSFIFMGDATSNVEEKLLNDNIDSDVLKVGHHGSKYSSTVSFLKKVTPQYAIISVGKNNSYGHPHDVTFSKLNDVGAKIYRTDEDGTIIVSSDGENVTFKTVDTELDG